MSRPHTDMSMLAATSRSPRSSAGGKRVNCNWPSTTQRVSPGIWNDTTAFISQFEGRQGSKQATANWMMLVSGRN